MGKVTDIILTGTLIAGMATLFELFVGGKRYEIDNHNVKNGNTYMNTIVEYPNKNIIRYSVYSNSDSKELKCFHINGERYTSKDTLVFEEAQKRYNYLKGQIDSIEHAKEQAKKGSKLQKKLDEERERTEKALELLRK